MFDIKASVLTGLVLGCPLTPAMTLADFSFERSAVIKKRGEIFRGCSRRFLTMRAASAEDLADVDGLVRRATWFIAKWRSAPSPESYFAKTSRESRSILEYAEELRSRVRLPGPTEEQLRGLLDSLALIQIFEGYAATERELEDLFQSALAKSSHMKLQDAIDDAQFEEYIFTLSVYRKQRMLADLKQTGERKSPTDEVRMDRDEHFRVLRADANKFRRRLGQD